MPRRRPKAIAGEDGIVERTADGRVKFVLWINTVRHLLPGSSVTHLTLSAGGG